MHANHVCLASQAKGDAHYGGASPFYLTAQKDCQQNILHGITPCISTPGCASTHAPHVRMCANGHARAAHEGPRGAQAVSDLQKP
jgi:hypothetical protein